MTPAPISATDKKARLQAWTSNQEKIERFRNLLADPVMQEALQLTQLFAIPSARRMSSDGNPDMLMTTLALDQTRQEGWHAALAAFDGLKNLVVPASKEDRAEWDYVGAPNKAP